MNLEWIITLGAVAGTLAFWMRRKAETGLVPIDDSPAQAGRPQPSRNTVTLRSGGSGPGSSQDPPQGTQVPAEGEAAEKIKKPEDVPASGPSHPIDPPKTATP